MNTDSMGAVPIGILGQAGTKAISKLASLLLAAIGIMLIRKGITRIIQTTGG